MSLIHEEWRQEGNIYINIAYYSRANQHLRDLP